MTRIIGLGFRGSATAAEIMAAIEAIAGDCADCRVAVPADKASAPAFVAALERLRLPLIPVAEDALIAADSGIVTRSPRVEKMRGVGSVAEAAALAGAGQGGCLVRTRIVNDARTVTAALAETAKARS